MAEAVVAAYLALVLAIGALARRRLAATGEDYFTASRTIGPVVLLLTLFGTHMTAFSLLGASGEAYHRGVGVFSLMASSSALVVPAVFYFVAPRAWAVCRRGGFLTQVELVRARWGSPALALAVGVALVALLVPYLLIGVMGGGITLAEITGGRVPQWAGSLAMVAVVLAYVAAGGIRGTSWVNSFQTVVFIALGAVTAGVVIAQAGGLAALASRVDPALLVHGDRVPALELLTYTLIPLSVGAFPHIFAHWLSAESPAAFKLPIVAYPLCVAAVWLPSVLVGVVASADLPGLAGPAANSVLIRAIDLHAPAVLAGLLAAGVFAAVMSSLDSQALALSSLVTRGLGGRGGAGAEGAAAGRRQLLLGRLAVALVLAVTFALSLVVERSIFRLGVWSFTGFASLFPLFLAALAWRRATAAGAWASLATAAALFLYYFVRAAEDPGYTLGGTGFMPVGVIVPAAALALAVVSLVTTPPPAETLDRFFPASGTVTSAGAAGRGGPVREAPPIAPANAMPTAARGGPVREASFRGRLTPRSTDRDGRAKGPRAGAVEGRAERNPPAPSAPRPPGGRLPDRTGGSTGDSLLRLPDRTGGSTGNSLLRLPDRTGGPETEQL